MRILLLSDLHIGTSARCLSLVPHEERDRTQIIDDNYVGHLETLLKKINKKIDYLIIAGDISDKASFEQFAHFDTLTTKVLSLLNISERQLFFTAGNHDADWTAFGEYNIEKINKARLEQRYSPLKSSRTLKGSLDNSTGNLLDSPYFCIWEEKQIFITSINTASFDSPGSQHHGSIAPETISALEYELEKRNLPSDKRVKILLFHHHPINYENPSPHWKDFSILQCHVDLINLSQKYAFDFIMHGHRHQPMFQSNLDINGRQLAIVCGGSFSHNFPSYIYDNLSNQLHLIEIDKRDHQTGILCGYIYNFAFSHRNGWTPSIKSSSGIEHKISFGPNTHRSIIKETAATYISRQIDSNGSCRLIEMVKDNHIFKYKSDELIFDIVQEICLEKNLEIFGNTIDQSVIIKGGCL